MGSSCTSQLEVFSTTGSTTKTGNKGTQAKEQVARGTLSEETSRQ